MNDNPEAEKRQQETDNGNDAGEQSQGTGEQELDFEHGYADQDNILSDDESLEDVAGVSEEDIREDLLGSIEDDRDDEAEEAEPEI